MTDMESPVVIFTDGACTGNPGPGGWASIVAFPDGTIKELGGGVKETTNNRMEMAATIRALAALEPPPGAGSILLYTDSTYVIQGITKWIWGWRSRGWKSADGKDVANRDLWEELSRQVARVKPATVEWKYVRGHSGYPGNERCDVIAVSFAKGKPEPLYTGSRDGYFVDLNELPEDTALPERKIGSSDSKSKSSSSGSGDGGPVSYIVYLGGVLTRYANWNACEKVVKGRPAKFKKVKSAQEERETLISWGLDPQSRIE